MNNLVFYIGLGIGFAIAAGVRPFLPALLAGVLGSSGALGVGFPPGHFHFLQSGWWMAAMAAGLLASYLLQLRLGAEGVSSGPSAAVIGGLGIGVGAVLFGGTLAAHGDASWPGLLGGALSAGLASAIISPLGARARARLDDRSARDALTLYLDGASLALSAFVALLHPLGYVVLALLGWLGAAGRRRSNERYAGLRILRRQ
jgi:hypothetical protein